MEHYKIDYIANTITITNTFAKKMQHPDTEEYRFILTIRRDFPNMQIIKRTHRSPRKYTNKSNETFRCNPFKRLSYKNMEDFIRVLPKSADFLREFETIKSMSVVQASRYALVRKWFTTQFPLYRSSPLFYATNDTAIVPANEILAKATANQEVA